MKKNILIFLCVICTFIFNSCYVIDDIEELTALQIKLCERRISTTHRYDGAIIVPNQNTMKLMILNPDPNADWNNNENIFWQWNVKRGKGVPSNQLSKYRSVFTNLSDVKRIIYDDQIHLIYCGSHGNGIAMMNMQTKNVIYWTNAGGSPHAIAGLPDGNMAVADAKGYIKVFSTLTSDNSPSQSFRHAGAHGVVWDATHEFLWAWGGSRMECYIYNNDRADPKLTSVKIYRLPTSWGAGGGHDLAPMLGTNKLLFSWRLGIGIFDTDNGTFTKFSDKGMNPKGLSHNPDDGEIIYTRPDSKDSRTYRVRSLTKSDRVMKNGKWYKARWFIHNTFSY